jgi:hypothetical protein
MLARCARCQGTFSTDRFGRQVCPHCGSELWLADPNAPRPDAGAPPPVEPPRPEAPAGEPGTAASAEPSPTPAPPVAPGAGEPPPAGPAEPAGEPRPSSPVWGAPPPPPERHEPRAPPPPSPWAPPPPGGGFAGGPPPPGGPYGPGPYGTRPLEPELPSPFAERDRRGFIGALVETWKLVALEPQRFFRRVRVDQTRSAVLFALVCYTIGNLAQSVFAWLSGQQGLLVLEQLAERMPPGQAEALRSYALRSSGWLLVAEVLLAPVLGLVALYVSSALVHAVLTLFRGTRRGFDATLTAMAYAFGLYLLLAVPACGGLVAPIWFLVVAVVGLGETQRCGPGKAAVAVLAPAVLVCVCCCGALGVGLGGLLKGIDGLPKGTTTL